MKISKKMMLVKQAVKYMYTWGVVVFFTWEHHIVHRMYIYI